MICRDLDEVRAAGTALGAAMPPLSQDTADLVACILQPYQDDQAAA